MAGGSCAATGERVCKPSPGLDYVSGPNHKWWNPGLPDRHGSIRVNRAPLSFLGKHIIRRAPSLRPRPARDARGRAGAVERAPAVSSPPAPSFGRFNKKLRKPSSRARPGRFNLLLARRSSVQNEDCESDANDGTILFSRLAEMLRTLLACVTRECFSPGTDSLSATSQECDLADLAIRWSNDAGA
jgi:hypothetical protein